MPEKRTIERAGKAKRKGKRPTTQAGEFVREEMEHIRHGKHGARSTKQAIAIGLSKARRAGKADRNSLFRSAFPKRVAPASSFHRPGLGKFPRKRAKAQRALIEQVKPG